MGVPDYFYEFIVRIIEADDGTKSVASKIEPMPRRKIPYIVLK